MSEADHNSARADALAFLWSRIDFERTLTVPYHAQGFKLDRMRELLRRLGNPQDKLRIVHIAGTKGKGSTAAMIASILSTAGIKAGLFSSPHLDRVEERIAVDEVACTSAELIGLVQRIRPVVETMDQEALLLSPPETGPTYFEITTAMSYLHFLDSGVQTAVIEVGMGGRLDSTNVCQPAVCVITSISFDHMKQLGNTLAEIAGEKAGIIKPGVPVISGVCDDEPRSVIAAVCRERSCPQIQLNQDFHYTYHPPRNLETANSAAHLDFHAQQAANGSLLDLRLNLLGEHQAANAAIALATIQELQRQGWSVPESAIRRGLEKVSWPARVEILQRSPALILDVAHNVASIAALVQVLQESFQVHKRYLIFGTTKDKDAVGMLAQLLPAFDQILLTRYTRNPRAMPVEELAAIAQSQNGHVQCFLDPKLAWDAVGKIATPADLICITGSFFLAAEMRELWDQKPPNGC